MTPWTPDLCIYHAPCQDGFTAAWAIWKRWGEAVTYVPAAHGDAPPDVAGKHVLIVDFSYRFEVLDALASKARSIVVLDHHKSAQADLARLPAMRACNDEARDEAFKVCWSQNMPEFCAFFDMQRSGAGLAWDFAHPGVRRPMLVDHVEDRDLWRFAIERTREISAELFSWPYSFVCWDHAADDLEDPSFYHERVQQGLAITRKHLKDVGELLDQTMRYMVIGGHRVPVANLPYTMCSDGANQLAEGNPFAATYFDRADGRRAFSLRSTADGLDVSEIAFALGGGGHARAAGFTAAPGWEGEG